MYRFVTSVSEHWVLDENWQKAMETARMKGIEFSCTGEISPEVLADAVKVLARLKVKGLVDVASIHIPFGVGWDIASRDEKERLKVLAVIKDFISATLFLNCKNYTLHGCLEPIPVEEREQAIVASRKSLLEFAAFAREQGISINLENLPRTCLGNTLEEMQVLLEGMPEGLGVCFDVNHLDGCPERIPQGLDLFAPRLNACHFSDYDGIDECHWYPGFGVIDWQAVMDKVRGLPRDLVLIFEVGGFLKPPMFRVKQMPYALIMRAMERNAYYVEHAREIEAMIYGT